MVEKTISLENISLPDFLGIENANIKEVTKAFPKCKIVSRGTEIRIKGAPPEILQINQILNDLLIHFQKYGKLEPLKVQDIIHEGKITKESLAESEDVVLYGNKGLVIRARSQNQEKIIEASKKNDLIFILGPAGTGKTFVAVALAVRALKNKEVKKIIITRPAVEAGENLGFLPGDLKEKIDPYLRPIYDALDEMIPSEKLKYYMENRKIEVAPLAYMRGRTLDKAFILLDEAQNTTASQIKMFLTRMGPNSKLIVNGDLTQIDLPGNQKSGLKEAVNKLKDINEIAILKLDAKDVVRHRLVRKIITAYETTSDDSK